MPQGPPLPPTSISGRCSAATSDLWSVATHECNPGRAVSGRILDPQRPQRPCPSVRRMDRRPGGSWAALASHTSRITQLPGWNLAGHFDFVTQTSKRRSIRISKKASLEAFAPQKRHQRPTTLTSRYSRRIPLPSAFVGKGF